MCCIGSILDDGDSAFHVFAQPQAETLVNLWVALEERHESSARKFRYSGAIDGSDGHGASIAQQIQAAGEVVAALAVRDDAFIAFIVAHAFGGAASDLDKAFENQMKRLAHRTPALIVFCEEALAALIAFNLGLLGQGLDIGIGYALEEREALENGADRLRGVNLVEEAPHLRGQFHEALHDLLWYAEQQ